MSTLTTDFDIPGFLRRERPDYLDLPISDWPEIPTPVRERRQWKITPPSQPATDSRSEPAPSSADTASPPATRRHALRGAARDMAALKVAKAIGEGATTVQRLRRHFVGQLDDRTLRCALRRARHLHLIHRPKGLRTYEKITK